MNINIEKPKKINFKKINLEKTLKNLENLLKKYKETIQSISINENTYNWNNFCQPIEEINNLIKHHFFPISHINSVKNNSKSRKIYKKSLLLVLEFNNWIGQFKPIYNAYKKIKEKSQFENFDEAQKKHIINQIRDFELSGINLSKEKKKKYKTILVKINKLENLFNNNILDSTTNWEKLIENKNEIIGIPNNILLSAKILAKKEKKNGWLFKLNTPNYISIMQYANNEDLRKEMYYAYNTRASNQSAYSDKWNNSDIILEILSLRNELAKILGFKNYAEKSLYTKTAKSTEEILKFINILNNHAYKKGKNEIKKLIEFTKKYYGINKITPWNFHYYSEKQKKKIYLIDNEDIKQFFPEKRVIYGIFKIVKKIYGIKIKKYINNNNWHPDVKSFKIYNKKNNLIGKLNMDLYFRENKNSGAWMDDSIGRFKFNDGNYQIPIANIICNFNKNYEINQSLLTHEEVITLFHEFGHALHHLLTNVDVLSVSGINGVPWDMVEIPSQLMENWCWQKEILEIISYNYKENIKTPEIILNKIINTKNYQSGIFILNQLKYSLFDIIIHKENLIKNEKQMNKILDEIQKKTSIIKNPIWKHFPNTFSHIFTGNYAAGYYGYLWSDVIASDIFSKFIKEGILNKKIGSSLLNNFLKIGGTKNIIKSIKNFLGRKPNIKSILNKYNFN